MSKVYVLGGAQTDFDRNWSREGKNPVAMLREVLSDGLCNAGITYEDIASLNKEGRVAAFVGSYLTELYNDQSNVAALLTEVNPVFTGMPAVHVEAAAASGAAALDAAVTKIKAGDADVAVVVGWSISSAARPDAAASFSARGLYMEKEAKGDILPNIYGDLTDIYLEKTGDESRVMHALARLTELGYDNAKKNPYAFTRKLFMNEKQANLRGSATNPLATGKLAASDMSAVTDGAAAVLLVSEGYAAKLSRKLPVVKASTSRTAPMTVAAKAAEAKASAYLLPWAKSAADAAYAAAGITAENIDVFELTDSCTIAGLASLTACGLCEPGEELDLIESGVIATNGKKPVNPTGGLIGIGNAQSATGVRMFLDLAKQVSGAAGAMQVDGAKNGFMLNLGGGATANFAFIVGME